MKESGPSRAREIDRWDDGVGWIAYPEETMRRASHALRVDDAVWLVDPLDATGVTELVDDLGPVVGVVITMGRHARDAATFADRYDVPVFLPSPLADSRDRFDVPVEVFAGTVPGTDYRVLPVVDWPGWREVALYGESGSTLVVGDALGTAPYFLAPGERLGVSPALRLRPPRAVFGELAPDRVLVGHGEGITTDATAALGDALAGARRRAPRLYARALRLFLPV